MALFNFLYKDEKLVASLYAQMFSGKLLQVSQGKTSSQKTASEIKGSVTIVSGSAGDETSFANTHTEVIDPHDAVTLDVLNQIDALVVAEESAKPQDFVKLSGGLSLVGYEQRKLLLDFCFSVNKGEFSRSLSSMPKNHVNKILESTRISCIGSSSDITFFFQSNQGLWYWGFLPESHVSDVLKVLKIAYGGNAIPVNLIAVMLGHAATIDDENPNSITLSSLNHLVGITNQLLLGKDKFITSALAPVAILQCLGREDAL